MDVLFALSPAFLFLSLLISVILCTGAIAGGKKPVCQMILALAFLAQAAGTVLLMYQKGSYEYVLWNGLNTVFHFGKTRPLPGLQAAFLTALNPHDTAWGFSDESMRAFLCFAKARAAVRAALGLYALSAFCFCLSALSGRFLSRAEAFLLPLISAAPAAITAWLLITLAGCAVPFDVPVFLLCLSGFLLSVFPAAYWAIARPPAGKAS